METALVLPVLLLILLIGIDAGRLFFGWVTLQNTARIGANFAGSHPTAWNGVGSPSDQARYEKQILADAAVINCTFPDPIPTPAFPSGQELGDLAVVGLNCEFDVLTPIVSEIIGDSIIMSAAAEFPIRTGIVAGGVTVPPPGPIPTPGATPNPTPLGTCTVPDFVGDGTRKNSADGIWAGAGFTGAITYSPNPAGNWTITSQSLPPGPAPCTSSITIGGAVVAPTPTPMPTPIPTPPTTCTVPSYVANGTKKNSAAGLWTGAGFTGTITYSPNPAGNWTITSQSLPPGPAPCTSSITIGG